MASNQKESKIVEEVIKIFALNLEKNGPAQNSGTLRYFRRNIQ